MYFDFGVKCVSVTQGKRYILAAATGDESLDVLFFFPILLRFPRTLYTSITDIDEETDICQTRNLTKKERKNTQTHRAVHRSPRGETGRAFKSRNSQVGRDRPAVDM